jgi:hypothetical protein
LREAAIARTGVPVADPGGGVLPTRSSRTARRWPGSGSPDRRIEIEAGPTLDLAVGDMASMPKGAVTTWHPSADFKEIWLYS